MTEKIEWYQEVFDIEPTSRIFLPLARLLKGEGALERAISVLQRGLVFHADMLEARLLLIECLYAQKDSPLLSTEMQKVTDILKAYPIFFEAWATIVQAQNKDLALSVRLLSHVLRDPSGTFVDVLAKGLEESAEYALDSQPVNTPLHAAYASTGPASAGTSRAGTDILLADTIAMANTLSAQYASELAGMPDIVDTAGMKDNPEGLSAAHLTIGSETSISSETAISSENSVSSEVFVPSDELEESDEETPEGTKPEGLDIAKKPEKSEKPEIPKVPKAPTAPDAPVKSETLDSAKSSTMSATAASADGSKGVPLAKGAQGEPQDAESMLRTRSMADLLAEQGSLDEAMAIYIELEAHETDAKELVVLQECIAKLRVQRGEEAQLGTVQGKASVSDSPVKGRVLSVLESLAARLEARSLA